MSALRQDDYPGEVEFVRRHAAAEPARMAYLAERMAQGRRRMLDARLRALTSRPEPVRDTLDALRRLS